MSNGELFDSGEVDKLDALALKLENVQLRGVRQ